MKDIILDILDHTANLNFFEFIKIKATDKQTFICAENETQTVFLNAVTNIPQPNLKGNYALGSLKYLNGLIRLPQFRKDDAVVEIKKQTRGDEEIPETINFSASDGTKGLYRITHTSVVSDPPTFKEPEWNISFTATRNKIDQFGQLASLYAEMETHFRVTVEDNKLIINLGDDGTHKASFVFHENINEQKIKCNVTWSIQEVLQVLRLSLNGTSTINISDLGIINIKIDSGLSTYNFILLGNQR